jgi:hypothetical protein
MLESFPKQGKFPRLLVPSSRLSDVSLRAFRACALWVIIRRMTTPLRQQYLDIRRRYPGLILLFQIGDFYECFDDDGVSRVK